jgi:hypothetical protein
VRIAGGRCEQPNRKYGSAAGPSISDNATIS